MQSLLRMLPIAGAALLTGCTHITGNGEKVGSVIKVSSEGLLLKTNEVEIVRGGMQGGSGGFSTTPLMATVNDPGILAKIQDALDKQYEVKVRYVDYLWTPLSSDSGSRYLVEVERFDPPQRLQIQNQKIVITNPQITVEGGVITIQQR